KKKARERTDTYVESPLEILVRRIDLRAVEERHRCHRQDDHCDRQAEVELDESQAGQIRLPCCPHQRDGAHLRRHHGQADRPPGQTPIAEEVPVDLVGSLGTPDSVIYDPHEIPDDDGPVEWSHRDQEKKRPRTTRPAMMAASSRTT